MTTESPHRPDQRDGFTLIELLIVIVVLGVLAAIAVPKLNVTKKRAYRSSMLSDLKSLANAQEVYHTVHYTYGSTVTDIASKQSEGVAISINEASGQGWAATASHAGVTGQHCGVYYGNADPTGGDPATTAGVVACTF